VEDNKLRDVLADYLNNIAEQARKDAISGKSNIADIYKDTPVLFKLDDKKIKEALSDIEKATMTKESTARFINAILMAAKIIAATTLR
jgi:hypothetical protein